MSDDDTNCISKCCIYLFDCSIKAYEDRISEENKHYDDIKVGIKKSMLNINERLSKIKNWDDLMNTDEDSEENKLLRNQTIIGEYKEKKCCFYFFGLLFCLFQLVGVQAGIIILNSLFSEIVEDFKIRFNNPREYSFYQKLEINTYRELPEIDIGMVTSTLGILVLKENGFKKTNSIFQLLSSILIAILFILFHFHTNDKLLESYNYIEILVLILSYVIFSILVGSSSTLALKELINVTNEIYYKDDPLNKSTEKFIFYSFSGLSMFAIIFINRLIFTSFKDMTSRWLLVSIIGVCFVSYLLSLIAHYFFMIPTTNKKIKNKNKNPNEIKEDNNLNIEDGYNNGGVDSNDGDKQVIFKEVKSVVDSELSRIKNNKTPEQNLKNDGKEKKGEQNSKKNNNEKYVEELEEKQINSTKVCTLCGYIYVKKQTGNQTACIFYRYTNRKTWLKEKIWKFDVIFTIIIELLCQFSIVGFNSILYEKLYNEYSFTKNIKFFTALIILCTSFSSSMAMSIEIINSIQPQKNEEKEKGINSTQPQKNKEKEDEEINSTQPQKNKKNEKEREDESNGKNEINSEICFDKKFCLLFPMIIGIALIFTLFTFISSICYYFEDDKSRKRWDNIIMAEFIFFKFIDMYILSFFDFLDNTDIFNTTLFITLEKVIWMVIEALFEGFETKEKTLIIIQIVFSSILPLSYAFLIIFGLILKFYVFICSKNE